MDGIIKQLDDLCSSNSDKIKEWFSSKYQNLKPPFYSSVDLRHSGLKLVPVDTNLFPAGFNNLSESAKKQAAAYLEKRINRDYPGADNILILPENHTRNQGYINNIIVLKEILESSGKDVRVGRMDGETVKLVSSEGIELDSIAITRQGNKIIKENGFAPDLLVVNNDWTAGSPDILCGIEQPVIPSPAMGWFRRRKSVYFEAYKEVANNFASDFSIDSWAISTLFHKCGKINFRERKGIECVALGVEKVIHKIKEKYDEYGIEDEPYVFIKADSGTYGMGIMTARSGEDVYAMNKKTRNKMNIVKEGVENSEVIIQEGVPTNDMIGEAIAEPVIYMVDGIAIGGAWRVHDARDVYNNLNASGMRFEKMESFTDGYGKSSKDSQAHKLVAEMASLAAAYEESEAPSPCDDENITEEHKAG